MRLDHLLKKDMKYQNGFKVLAYSLFEREYASTLERFVHLQKSLAYSQKVKLIHFPFLKTKLVPVLVLNEQEQERTRNGKRTPG